MLLAERMLKRIDSAELTHLERVKVRCSLARELEQIGNYEAARGALGDLWKRVGERPDLEGLNEETAAEVLLRVGSLTGWIGNAKQIPGAQETAKDLICESADLFRSLNMRGKVAEAQVELAWCYWREGAFDEARITLQESLGLLGDQDHDVRAVAIIRYADVERAANRLHDALRILIDAAPSIEICNNHTIRGRYHNTLAIVLKNLGAAENRADYSDRALIEFAAASFHFEQAGHTRYRARVENNLGFQYLLLGRFAEAHQHLDRARRLFAGLKDQGSIAQVDETRARVLLAQGRFADAERAARSAVSALEKGGEQAVLAEALSTLGTALARQHKVDEARTSLYRAIYVAESVGDKEGAGRAMLALIETLSESLLPVELQELFEKASLLLQDSQNRETAARLCKCAGIVFSSFKARVAPEPKVRFIHLSDEAATLLRYAERVASKAGRVLITGETGTGKEVLARLIHQWSGRRGRFVAVNCAALSDTLFQSQVFGHRKGSFTDAHADYPGAALEANGGTLFLDEIGELSPSNQAGLLRLVEHGEVRAIGSVETQKLDLLIIAATNRDLRDMTRLGSFREDLYYRLATYHIEVPPLRKRPSDIMALARHFIAEVEAQYGKRLNWTADAIEALCRLRLMGNARELRALIERAVLTGREGQVITSQAVEMAGLNPSSEVNLADPWRNFDLVEEVERYEREIIRRALESSGGKLTSAARLLGLSHQSLSFILKGRHKELSSLIKAGPKRRRSIIRVAKKEQGLRAPKAAACSGA
jgi:transcriptional regulator with GAF, ATPase, and Fis domain